MSWLRDNAGDLHNLDHVQRIVVLHIEGAVEGEDEDTHAVCAFYPDTEQPENLFTGSEAACKAKLDSIAGKMPMVRL